MDTEREKLLFDFDLWWNSDAKKEKKIFIAGCGGMLGEAFFKNFINGYHLMPTDIDVNERWLRYCDIRNPREYGTAVFDYCPDYLFHLGALTDLEQCEGDIDNTYMTNTIGVENAVYIANRLEIPLLYISTAGIFDGKKQFYDDWDTPNPLCHYARSKYAGELYVRENCQKTPGMQGILDDRWWAEKG